MPATIYHFVGYFPKGRYDGNRKLLSTLYAFSVLLAFNSMTPYYITDVALVQGDVPQAAHHKSIALMGLVVAVALIAIHRNLRRKYRDSQGFGRRQIQFVMTGIYAVATLGLFVIMLEPVFQISGLQAYAPIIIMLMVVPFAYAMIRYHLLDTRALVSKLCIYLASTAFVILTVYSVFTVVEMTTGEITPSTFIFAAAVSGLIVSLAYHSVYESVEHFIAVTVLQQRYDVDRLYRRLYRRLAELAGEATRLDTLLPAVARDIQDTIRVKTIRVWLADPDDPMMLRTEFTSVDGESTIVTRQHRVLIDFFTMYPKPLILEKVLHRRLDERMVRVAHSLAELEAYFCMPLSTNEGVVGILTLGQKETHDVYSEQEVLAFRALSGPLATAITNARLYRELESVHMHQTNVFGQMREGVIAVNTKGVITLANRAALDMVGDATKGSSMEDIHPEVHTLLKRTLEARASIHDFEVTIQNSEEEMISVIMSSSCLFSNNGTVDGAIALLYDLSQVKLLEQNVQRADRLSSIGTLATGMAHEIKNPLVSIKTFTQLLLERYEDPDFRETFHDVVPHEVDRIDTIVSRLLDFARPRPVKFEPQNIRTVINEVLALVENEMRRGNIELEIRCPKEDLSVYGDEQQLHQVFLNLVMNAIDAMDQQASGQLLIEIEQGVIGPVEHDAGMPYQTRPCVVIIMTDSGCGIPEPSIQELFTPFFTTKDKGCGLGLAVVHGIVSEHGGRIDVSSVVDESTTIRVSLPKALSRVVATTV